MAKLLLNADGKVLMGNGNVYKAPEDVNVMKTLLDGRKEAKYLFQNYDGESVEHLISYNDTENVTTTQYMFSQCKNLNTIPNLDTKNSTDMKYMFYQCNSLQTIPLLDTSNVTDMSYMFMYCYELQTISLLDTSNVTNMNRMFDSCNKLQAVPLLDTSKTPKMSYTFNNCFELQTIDITSMDLITSTNNSSYFAGNCHSLTKLIIRTMTVIPTLNSDSLKNCYHFDGTVSYIYNPDGLKDGRIYVPDNMVESLKSATNWSVYADIIVPLSTLVEE